MNTPDQERLDVISEALAKIIRRQDALESRFRSLEIAMGVVRPPVPEPVLGALLLAERALNG